MQGFPLALLRSRDEGRLDSIDANSHVCLSIKASGETLSPSISVCTDSPGAQSFEVLQKLLCARLFSVSVDKRPVYQLPVDWRVALRF